MDPQARCEPEVLWRLGDRWRRLEEDIEAFEETVTVVTENGTAQVMSLVDGWQQRVPLEGGHVMKLDFRVRPLAMLSATSCGVSTIDGRGRSHKTSRVILMLRGEHPQWLLSEVGRDVFKRARTEGWAVEGHKVTDA